MVAFDNFREGAVLETELNWDRCRASFAQDPDLRRTIQWRLGAWAAASGRAASGRIAQRLIRCTGDIVASVDHDFNRRRHAGFEQQFRIGRGDDDVIGREALDSLRRRANLRHLAGEGTVREGLDRECGLVSEIDFVNVVLADVGVDTNDGEICCDEEKRRRL
jgi:hypothetical protein